VSNLLDLLINEVASVLGISPEEVKNKFSEEQLKELLDVSLCEPTSDVGLSVESLEIPCEDLSIPELLPPLQIDTSVVDVKPKDPTKCVKKVEELNAQLEKELEEYNRYLTLLEKLIEYRDNYEPVSYYFTERANEVAKILKDFEPLLIEEERLKNLTQTLNKNRRDLRLEIARLQSSGSANSELISQKSKELLKIESELVDTSSKLIKQKSQISVKTQTYPIFNNSYFKDYQNYLQDPSNSSYSQEYYLRRVINNYIDTSTLNTIDSQLRNYAEGLSAKIRLTSPNSVQQIIENSYFRFELKFPKLIFIELEKEIYNKQDGSRKNIKVPFPIKDNPLLEKNSFFKENEIFKLSDFPLSTNQVPSGRIYVNYYNLFEDPINNFFSPQERGLTNSASLIDPKVKGSGAEVKKEKDKEFYIQDINKLQNFYNEFESRFKAKKEEKRTQVINSAKEAIRLNMAQIARKEVQLILAFSGVNQYLPQNSGKLRKVVDQIRKQNSEFAKGIKELNEEIERIQLKVEELKPTPDKIKKRLKESSPECFEKVDAPIQECQEVKNLLGSDPLFTKTIKGCDPTLPNYTQLCYWLEFSKIVNLIGLLPLPHAKQPAPQLRYWPVGLTIPYPGGLIKIPLPIIWLPLISLSTPAGTIVIFLTINGIFISPVVFFVSNTGFKQHIITLRGSSQKFGYSASDESIKPGVQLPAKLLSIKSKAERLAKEATLGKNFNLSQEEKDQLARKKTILKESESAASANGNENKLAKIKREKENLDRATEGLSDQEKLQKTLDKVESFKDVIDDLKQSLYQRIDELGKPPLIQGNRLKDSISTRKEKLLLELQQKLEIGDLERVAQIREELKEEGISLAEKLDAIESDLTEYFKRLKFPKITIPKDKSKIDPKQNVIVEFIESINEFSNIYRTQFYSKDNSKVRNLLMIQIAKSKNTLLSKIEEKLDTDSRIDIEEDLDGAKQILKDVNSQLVDELVGKGEEVNEAAEQAKIKQLQEALKKEKDSKKKFDIGKKLQKAQVKLSEGLEKKRVKEALSLTPTAIAAFNQTSISFDAFAPCCKKEPFTLPFDLSPAVPILESVKTILDAAVDKQSADDLKALFGGKTRVSAREMLTAQLNLIKNQIPKELEIPLPDLNLVNFIKAFSGIFVSLFEIKPPIPALQPALPASITIDLNILKDFLLKLLISFLRNSMPDPNQGKESSLSPAQNKNQLSGASPVSDTTQIESGLDIIDCEPDFSQNSAISDGTYSPEKSTQIKTSSRSEYSSSNVVTSSSLDILPAFQFLDTDFINLNPGDLLVTLKNFIDLKLDTIEKLIDPFYSLLKTIKGAKGTNQNILEAAQYKAPPYGPAEEAVFIGITKAKQAAPTSASFKIIDASLAEQKVKLLESTLGPIANSPLPALIAAAAGVADSILPSIKAPQIDPQTGAVSTKDLKVSSLGIRQLHPLLSQEDLPPWERLSVKNILFLLFVDEFVANGADQVGFFRSFV
jgi:hypothetical protein